MSSATSAALVDDATVYARKRFRCGANVPDHVLLQQLTRSALGLPLQLLPERRPLGEASATQQLLALLAVAVGRTEVVHADEATGDSDSEHGISESPQSSSQRLTPPSSQRKQASQRAAIIHSGHDLPPDLLARAQSADALPGAVSRLLEAGADANARDADSNTPLFLAVYLSDVRAALTVVHDLLRRGADPNSTRCGGTVLNHALANRRAPLVQRLLRDGAYPHASRSAPKVRLEEFSRASGFGDEALIHMRKSIWTAAKADDVRAVSGLLQHGCPAEQQLLFTLVRQRCCLSCVQELLRAGADPNVSDNLGTHVLTIAVLQGDESIGIVRALLVAGADPSLEEDGSTILELARGQPSAPEIRRVLERHVAGGKAGSSGQSARTTPKLERHSTLERVIRHSPQGTPDSTPEGTPTRRASQGSRRGTPA